MGESHAYLAANEGAQVVVNDISAFQAERVARTIRERGGTALAYVANVSEWDAAQALVKFCLGSYGSLDGFVSNAALFHMALPQEETEASVRSLFEVNILGTAFCGYAALRHMLRVGRGSLANISSGSQAGIRGQSAYGASKGAVASMTYGWALDAAGTEVRVNAVSPLAHTRMTDATAAFFRSHGQGEGHQITISPENNSPLVIYLLSDLSHSVQGQIIRVQGPAMHLMTHPAVLHAGVDCGQWTVHSVASAFSSVLEKRQLPLGVCSYDVTVRPYDVPYTRAGLKS
jgi:NAD(P)-dependent dehydrogenase (short-subunit alcohol dehydrogenase family)